jgi:hypothetical protein
MAHLDPRFQHPEPADRALLRVVCTWNTLAISALALMVVAPMLVISALLMLEAVLPSSRHNVEAFHGERPGAYARTTFTSVSLTRKAGERSKRE